MYFLYLTAALAALPVHVLSAPHAVTCPTTPSPFPKAASFDKVTTLPDPFLYLNGKDRVKTKEEWFACRQPEIMQFLQEYQYGYYPEYVKLCPLFANLLGAELLGKPFGRARLLYS